jgi:hypothetical protein
LSRKDEDANVLVGYIPALCLFTQGRTEDELSMALVSAAEMYIVKCYELNILSKVLRERGMTKASGRLEAEELKAKSEQFITVTDLEPLYDREFTVSVPIELVAAQQVGELCRQ